MDNRTIVVTGEKGRLGSELVKRGCSPLGLRITLETAENGALRDALGSLSPQTVINCASYTRVDQAEDHPEQAHLSNVTAVYLLRGALATLPTPPSLIHISTDYVFKGDRGPYPEFVQPADLDPPSVYGRTKLQGELEALRYQAGSVCVARTTLLFSEKGRNFVTAMIEQFRRGVPFPLYFADLRGNPTYIPYLAQALLRLVIIDNRPNTVHLAGSEVVTRANLAWQIADVFDLDRSLLEPTSSAPPNFEGAPRAVYGGLGTAWAKSAGLSMPPLKAALLKLREVV